MNSAKTQIHPAATNAYRIVALHRRHDGKEYRNSALLYRSGDTFEVEWTSKTLPDTRLKPGAIVSPRYGCVSVNSGCAVEISRLVFLERPEATLNLFDMVPESWVADRDLVSRASALWLELPYYLQSLFNTIFWCGERFKRYCVGQSSIRHHHACVNGNLEHSVEVAEIMLSLLHLYPEGNNCVAIMAGLLHDAGKADEYYDRGGNTVLSNRGRLLGHKVTIIEWIAVARDKMRVGVPDQVYVSLVHTLTATGSAAPYSGLREAKTPEAALLTHADRLSGNANQALNGEKLNQSRVSVRSNSTVLSTSDKPHRPAQRFLGMEALMRSIQAANLNEQLLR